VNNQLVVVTTENRLGVRDPFDWTAPWTYIGPASTGPDATVTAITGLDGQLWATTTTNRLRVRSAGRVVDWTDIGHANDVTEMTAVP
jgi:hypothetical protein